MTPRRACRHGHARSPTQCRDRGPAPAGSGAPRRARTAGTAARIAAAGIGSPGIGHRQLEHIAVRVDARTRTGCICGAVSQCVASRLENNCAILTRSQFTGSVRSNVGSRSRAPARLSRNSLTTCSSTGCNGSRVAVQASRPPPSRPRAKSSTLSIRPDHPQRRCSASASTMATRLVVRAASSAASSCPHRSAASGIAQIVAQHGDELLAQFGGLRARPAASLRSLPALAGIEMNRDQFGKQREHADRSRACSADAALDQSRTACRRSSVRQHRSASRCSSGSHTSPGCDARRTRRPRRRDR